MTQAQLDKANSDVYKLLKEDTINLVDLLKKKHKNYTILKYDKEKCTPSLYFRVGYLRNMIIDRALERVVCVGPTKSIPLEELDRFSDVPLHYEEFVDGVMINVFWEEATSQWQYATRSNIGADIKFYFDNDSDKKTFRTMFEEALVEDKISLDCLPKTMCYTFVLQHPDNRIVAPVAVPHVVLVEAHLITDKIVTIYPHGFNDNDRELKALLEENNITIPKLYSYENHQQARENHASRNTDFACVGIMVKNYATGWRSKIRNPVYESVKQLRGNQPKLQFLYLVLRQTGSVYRYLKFYQEHAAPFERYRKQVHDYTNNLYVNYVDCFINKKAALPTFPYEYRGMMKQLHSKFLNELMRKNMHIHKGVVIQAVNQMPPARLMSLLNYNFRK